jgi:hypothetical protein
MPESVQASVSLSDLNALPDDAFISLWSGLSGDARARLCGPGTGEDGFWQFDRYYQLTHDSDGKADPAPADPDPAINEAVRSLLDVDHGDPPPDVAPPPGIAPEGQESPHSTFMRVPAQPETEEWPEPVDFWQQSHLPPVKAEYLPQVLSDFALDQADIVGSDPIAQVGWCLGICSALIRESISLQMQANDTRWQERARLWIAIIGKASTRKGPAWNSVKDFFIKLSNEQFEQQEVEFKSFEEYSRVQDKRMEDWVRAEAKSPGSMPHPEPLLKPPLRRLWTEDATKEALSGLLGGDPGHSRGKILLYRDELAGWFGGWDAYSSNGSRQTDRPDYLSAYEGSSRWIDRVGPGRAVHVNSWSVPILGGIQPSILETIRTRLGEDGCLARMILLISKDGKFENARPPDMDAKNAWERMLRRLLDMEPGISPVKFSPDAQEYRGDCARWIFERVKDCLNPSLTAALGKYDGLLGRLCIIYHACNCATANRQIPDPTIPMETVVAAWAFIKKIVYPNAISFYELGRDDSSSESISKRVAGRILIHGWPSFTLSTLVSGYRTLKDLSIQQRRELIAQLEIAGWIRRDSGRISRSTGESANCVVNPKCLDGRFDSERKRYVANRDHYKAMIDARKVEREREPGE